MLNAGNIQTLNEGSTESKACLIAYQISLDSVLRRQPWSFASAAKTLAELSEEDALDFSYVYQLPADYLQVQGTLSGEDEQPEYIRRGTKFYSNENPCHLKYTVKIENPEFIPADVVQAVAATMALQMCVKLGKSKMLGQLATLSNNYFRVAAANDGKESHKESTANRTYVNVRL